MIRSLCSAAMLCLLAAPVAAQETVQMAPGCEVFVTIQERSCEVRHLFRCEGDPAGDLNRIIYDADGASYRGTIDTEAQWIAFENLRTGYQRFTLPDPVDQMSLSELMETGTDTFDFITFDTNGNRNQYQGYDRLIGEVEIDGVRLLRTEYSNRRISEDGVITWESRGTEYVHPEWRTFLGGETESNSGDGWTFNTSTPVDFIFPGEPGFMSTRPLYDCDDPFAKVEIE